MTLVLAAVGAESIWLLADRRLSVGERVVAEDARKVAFLHTPDGVAILGYAGIGRTPGLTEPSDWINAVLRGVNLPLERALAVLADAVRSEIPPLLMKVGGRLSGHTIVAPAFLQDRPAFYSIDIAMQENLRAYDFEFARHATHMTPGGLPIPPRVVMAGSGMAILRAKPDLIRLLVSLLRAHDRKAISSLAMADFLATINDHVHRAERISVGRRSIVAWRYRKGGGAHQFYEGMAHDRHTGVIPTIMKGQNLSGLIEALTPHHQQMMKAHAARKPLPKLSQDEADALMAQIPIRPDRKLR